MPAHQCAVTGLQENHPDTGDENRGHELCHAVAVSPPAAALEHQAIQGPHFEFRPARAQMKLASLSAK